MDKKYIICMDASGDINEQFAHDNEILFVPMEYSLGDEMRTSFGNEPEELLKRFYDGQKHGDLTKTSQITPFMYEEFFDQYLKEGNSILYFALSSGLSSTYNSACLAQQALKEKYPNVDMFPVDTLAATGGIGVLVTRAIENRNKGMSIEDNFEDMKSVVPHIHHWFMVQDLMYLKRGGRISSATAIVGSMLNIKPILMINNVGKLETISKKRGNKQALSALIEYFNEHYVKEMGNVVYICHSDALDLANFVKEELLKIHPELTIELSILTPIIGAHTGPGMVAVCHLGK